MFLFILQESETGQGYYSAPSPNPSVDSSGDGDGKKKRRPKFIRIVDCHVCGDKANDHIHYGAICKFQSTTTNKIEKIRNNSYLKANKYLNEQLRNLLYP